MRVEVGRGGLVVLLRVEVAVLALGPAVVAQEAVDGAALFLRGATVEVLEEESCEGERRSGELRTLDLFTGYGEGLVESCAASRAAVQKVPAVTDRGLMSAHTYRDECKRSAACSWASFA